jgi:hypothetical protein
MAVQTQNPGWQAGGSLDQDCHWVSPIFTVSERQAQMLGSRFCLSPWMAQDLAWLCFGERSHD